MALFTPEELEELRRADEETDRTFSLTEEEKETSRRLDSDARLDRKDEKNRKKSERERDRYKRNREKKLAKQKEYYRKNREQRLAYRKAYYEEKKRRNTMATPRMTIKEVADDMRNRGMGLTNKTLTDNIANGTFPFGTVINIGETGRRTFLIFRRDYEAWAEKYLAV